MLRTRDFLLYLIVLGFLIVIAVATTQTRSGIAAPLLDRIGFSSAPAPTLEVQQVPVSDKRAERLAALQAKIAEGEGQLISAPPDFSSVDSVSSDVAVIATGTVAIAPVQYCGIPTPHPAASSWPAAAYIADRSADTITIKRVVRTTETVGTTTTSQTAFSNFASLPIRVIRSNFDSCLPDTTIGVNAGGQLLDNRQTDLFAHFAPTDVVGYTRDGFTLFGPVPDESVLDTCGGQYVGGLYQYHVRVGAEGLISCYAGIPVSL